MLTQTILGTCPAKGKSRRGNQPGSLNYRTARDQLVRTIAESFEQEEKGLFLPDRNPVREWSNGNHRERIVVAPDSARRLLGVEVEWYPEGVKNVYFGTTYPDMLHNGRAALLARFAVSGEGSTGYVKYDFSLRAGTGEAFYWDGFDPERDQFIAHTVSDARALTAAAAELHAINHAAASQTAR